MSFDLGAFWRAAAPGINSALDNHISMQHQQLQQQHDLELHLLGKMQEQGDPQLQQYAQNKLLEIASLGPKYKPGSALKEIQGMMQPGALPPGQAGPPAPPDAGAGAGAATDPAQAFSGGLPDKPGVAAPATGAPKLAAPAGSAAQVTSSPTQQDAGGGAMPPGAALPAPVAPPTPGGAQAPPSAPSAGAATPGGAAPGAVTQAIMAHPSGADLLQNPFLAEVSQIADALHASGMVPSTAELRTQTAKQYGASADQLEDPNYAYTNHMQDPRKAAAQADYRARLQHAQDQAGTEGRALTGQMYSTKRAEAASDAAQARAETNAKAAEDRADKRAKLSEEGMNLRAKLERERQDRIDHRATSAHTEKQAAALEKAALALSAAPKGTAGLLEPKEAKAARLQKAQELKDHADALRKGPAALPPAAPLTGDEQRKASQLIQQMRAKGLSASQLPPEAQDLLRRAKAASGGAGLAQ